MAEKAKPEAKADRIVTIPLRKSWLNSPTGKRGKRAINTIKLYVFRHTKASEVKISQRLNESVWSRSISRPPSRIKVKLSGDGGVVSAMLPEEIVLRKEEKKGRLAKLREAAARKPSEPAAPAAGQGNEQAPSTAADKAMSTGEQPEGVPQPKPQPQPKPSQSKAAESAEPHARADNGPSRSHKESSAAGEAAEKPARTKPSPHKKKPAKSSKKPAAKPATKKAKKGSE